MLEIKNLTKYYGKTKGVENLSFEVSNGEIFGFVGPNGAGKSTTIKCIMKLINKTSGEILINEKNIDELNDSYKESIGYLPSEISLYSDMSVKNLLAYNASFYKKDCSKRIKELVKRLDLDIKKNIDELSLGNLKKVGIVCALMHSPNLVIMDEPTSGLDPLMQNEFYEILREEKEKGATIFFSSHNLEEVKKICDRVGIIKSGKLIKLENIQKMQDEYLTITLTAKDKVKIVKELKAKVMENTSEYVKFIYDKDIDNVIKVLGKYDIDKLLITEPSLEEVFMHYYKED